ncbi:MAG: hypothetical protein PHE33_11845, partial [Bacteroidales bacterium]|nr:hypothetical protein [Bacteroidales bacterium]
MLKMIKNTPEGYHEVLLNDYININGGAWIEQEVVFKLDSEMYMVEKYFDIRVPDEKRTEINVSDFNEIFNKYFIPVELLINMNYRERIKIIIIDSFFQILSNAETR